MSKSRLAITAVVLEGRPVAEGARDYTVARPWVYELLTRYRTEGEAAFEPRSKAPKTTPGTTLTTHQRVRQDRIDKAGIVTLRHDGRLHHIGVGRTYAGTYVMLLVQDLQIRIIDAATGELLRELVLDPTKDYQPTGRPPGPTPRKQKAGPTKT